jgi:hypothetical protein
MTSGPSLPSLLDALSLVWCALHNDREGQQAILAAADLAEVSRALALRMAAELATHHGHDQADVIVSRTRRILLELERPEDNPPPDLGPNPIWPD